METFVVNDQHESTPSPAMQNSNETPAASDIERLMEESESVLSNDQAIQPGLIQMVQPIKAPTLSSFSRLALVNFRMAHDRYMISTKANGIHGRTQLECMDPKLLVVLSKQYLQKDASDITNVDLETFIGERLSKAIHCTEEGMRRIFANIKMDLNTPDPIQRVTEYNIKYLSTEAEHGWYQLSHQAGFRKQVVGLLLDGVRPKTLQLVMRQKTRESDARSDPKAFFDLLEYWAPMQEIFHTDMVKTAKYVKDRTFKANANGAHPKGVSKAEPRFNKRYSGKNKRKFSCLICGKNNHSTKEHRGASKEDIDKAFNAYRDKKAAVSTEPVLMNLSKIECIGPAKCEKAIRNLIPSNEVSEGSNSLGDMDSTKVVGNKLTLNVKALSFNVEIFFETRELPMVKINRSLEVPCLLDSGTDHPVICRDIVDRLAVESYRLTTPLSCELPMEEKDKSKRKEVICTERTTLDLALIMPDVPGKPLMCPQVPFYIADDTHMPVEVLLGRSFLKKRLGIDIDAEVSQLARKQETDVDIPDPNVQDFTNYDIPIQMDTEDHDFQSARDVQDALESMIQRAFKAGLPVEYEQQLRSIVNKYDIWRTVLGPDPPAKVPPMKLKLKPGAPSIQAANRRYPPMYREFMNKRLTELEKYGLVYRNNTSRYSSAVHVVPKVDKPTDIDKHLRWTVDLREVNKWIEPITWPMPNLDVVSEAVWDAKVFSSFDFLKGYWQTPLHEESRELLSMVTDRAVYTPTRVIMGVTDAVMYFQSTMQNCFDERLYKSLLLWIDDLLSYAPNIPKLLDNMEFIFGICAKYLLKLNPDKCELFANSVKFCGKIFSANGIEQDPERIKSLVSMPTPNNAAELQQYLCALNWMRNHIPDFARLCKPLRRVLEKACKGTTRKSRVLKRVPITLSETDVEAFRELNESVAKTVMLAHPSQEKEFFLFTDASDDGWGSVLFQW